MSLLHLLFIFLFLVHGAEAQISFINLDDPVIPTAELIDSKLSVNTQLVDGQTGLPPQVVVDSDTSFDAEKLNG